MTVRAAALAVVGAACSTAPVPAPESGPMESAYKAPAWCEDLLNINSAPAADEARRKAALRKFFEAYETADRDQAISRLESCIDQDPDARWCYRHLARHQARDENPAAAFETMRRMYSRYGTDVYGCEELKSLQDGNFPPSYGEFPPIDWTVRVLVHPAHDAACALWLGDKELGPPNPFGISIASSAEAQELSVVCEDDTSYTQMIWAEPGDEMRFLVTADMLTPHDDPAAKRDRVIGGSAVSSIQRVIQAHLDQALDCFGPVVWAYCNGEVDSPKVDIDWTIELDGSVSNARQTSGSAVFGECFLPLMQQWKFPPPEWRTEVSYPFLCKCACP